MSTSAYQWAKPHALFGLKVIAAQPVQPIARPILQPGIGGSFNPTSLFSAGEQGVWYDPSDFSTMFQDAAGTTPVTAVEQTVGRILDKSGRGNHATQTTATSRPVLSARYNLLRNTETLATQSVTTMATTQRLRFEGTGTITLSGTATGTYSAGSHTFTTTAGTLTLTVSGAVTKADLRAANDALGQPAYQRVGNVAVTLSDYDTTGFKPYLRFDGTDDWLVTNSIDFTATDKVTVFAGVRKTNSDSSAKILIETSDSSFSNNGTFGVFAPIGLTVDSYAFQNRGTALSAPLFSNYISPITNIVTGVGDISGDLAILRVNGTQVAQSTADQGTGNYGNYPLFIGRRAGTTFPFNGHLYSLIVRGAQSTAQQITATENWLNQRTGAF